MNPKHLARERVRMLVSFALNKGLNAEDCLANTGITACHLDTLSPIPDKNRELNLLSNIVEQVEQCPFELGYELGSQLRYNQLKHFTEYLNDIRSITDALLSLNESVSGLFSYSRFNFSFTGLLLRVSMDLSLNDVQVKNEQAIRYFLIGRNIGLFMAIHRALLYGEIKSVRELGFDIPRLPGMKSLLEQIDASLLFSTRQTYVSIDVQELEFRHFVIGQLADQLISGRCCQPASEEGSVVDSSQTDSLKQKVFILFEKAGHFDLSKEDVARELNMSSRTFSRRLQEEQTHWRKLVSEIRIKKARQLLEDNRLTIQQVADAVGFSSASAFSIAFSKSVGLGAAEYRKRLFFSSELVFPQRVVGREWQLSRLVQGLNVARQGRTHFVLLEGEAGVGKSALLKTFFKDLPDSTGKFIAGKYDQYRQEAPFSSVGKSFSEMINSILAQGPSVTEAWREKWLQGVGQNHAALVKRFPQFELILGSANISDFNREDEYSSFVDAFVGIIRASGGLDKPLVLFIDDLQWADFSTLSLMEQVLINHQDIPLLVIGTCRTQAHNLLPPLDKILQNLRDEGVSCQQLELDNFGLAATSEYLSCVMGSDSDPSLIEYCYQKTEGNPFYLSCLLKELVQRSILSVDQERLEWCFNRDSAESAEITMNLPGMLRKRLLQLGDNSLKLVKLAALLGDQTQCRDLLSLSELKETDFILVLDELVKAEVIEKVLTQAIHDPLVIREQKVRFVHDQVQENVFDLIEPFEKDALHTKIVRYYFEIVTEQPDLVFELLDHGRFVYGHLTLTEQRDMAELACRAARKAAAVGDWIKARDTSKFGISLLGGNAWLEAEEICSKLYLTLCESLSFLADYQSASLAISESLENMPDQLSRARVRGLELTQMTLQGYLQEALEAGLEGLAEIGVELRPGKISIEDKIQELRERVLTFSDHSLEQLLCRSTSNDPTFLAISQLSKGCAPAAFLTGRMEIYTALVLNSAAFSLESGYTVGSSLNFSAVAPMLPSAQAEFCHRLGQLSLRLSSRFNNPKARVESLLVYALYASSWRDAYRDTESLLMEALRIGNKAGDRLFLSYCPPHLAQLSLFGGRSLASVDAICEHYMPLLTRLNVQENIAVLLLTKQVVRAIGRADNDQHSNDGEDSLYSEVDRLSKLVSEKNDNIHQRSFLSSTMLFYAVMMGDATQARRYVSETLDTLFMHEKQFYEPERLFLIGMALSECSKPESIKLVSECISKLEEWARISRDNHLCKYLLLKAEKKRVEGSFIKDSYHLALALYDETIEQAYLNGFTHLEALAAEKAAIVLMLQGRTRAAHRYICQAYDTYSKWGARAKLMQLRCRYQGIIEKSVNSIEHVCSDAEQEVLS